MQVSSKLLGDPQSSQSGNKYSEAPQFNKVVSPEDFLTTKNTATLVSLDIPFDDGLEVGAKATPPPEPEPEPEEEEPVIEETPVYEEQPVSTSTESSTYPNFPVGNSITETALQFEGYPYVFAGSSPSVGFDCSGFTSYVYAQHGISLPRTSYAQAGAGVTISASEAKPGDLVISNGGDHVMIYLGNGKVIHASTPATGVKISDIWGPHWFVRVQ